MTRKKSNVKALALAVTCAILAGGYSGLNPVYAVEALYKENGGSITADASGATGEAGATKWKLTVIDSGMKIGNIDLGLTNSNAITIGSSVINSSAIGNWNSVYNDYSNGKIAKATDVESNKTNIEKINKLLNVETKTLEGMDSISSDKIEVKNTLKVGDQEITATKVKNYDVAVDYIYGTTSTEGLVHKTQGITYDGTNKKTIVAGTLQVADSEGTSASLWLGDSNKLTAEQLGRINSAISATSDGSITISGKLYGAYGSEIGNVKFENDGKISGVKDINNGILKIQRDSANENDVLQINGNLELNDNTLGTGGVATLTRDGLSKLNNLVSSNTSPDKRTEIYAGNGSEVGGVKFNDGKLENVKIIKSKFDGVDIEFRNDDSTSNNNTTTIESTLSVSRKTTGNYGNVIINAGEENQVKIGKNGIAVGKNSSHMDADNGFYTDKNLYVGSGYVYDDATNTLTTAPTKENSKFFVDGQTGDVWSKGKITADAAGFNNLNVTGGAWIGDTTTNVKIGGGGIIATNGTDSVTIGNGTIVATGDITANKLHVQDIVLGGAMYDQDGNPTGGNISVGSDGHITAAKGAFKVDTEGQITNEFNGTNSHSNAFTASLKTTKDGIIAKYTSENYKNLLDIGTSGVRIAVEDETTGDNKGNISVTHQFANLGYGIDNGISVGEDILYSRLGTDVTRTMTNKTDDKSIVDKVGTKATRTIKEDSVEDVVDTAKRTLKAYEIVDEVAGMTVTTNNAGTTFNNGTTTTKINGSIITSTKFANDTGVLDGSNLTLTKDADHKTELTAGGAIFTGDAGEKDGKTTTINGGTITTDTLNVGRINLGEDILDSNGTLHGGNLSMDKYGNIKAAGGNFTVAGTDKANPGKFTNIVGDTSLSGQYTKLETDIGGAGFGHKGASGQLSSVYVTDNNAKMSTGTDASVSTTNDAANGGTTTIKGGTQTVTTDKNGTKFENTGHDTAFVTGGRTDTIINGNEIKTGRITTDELVITGKGNADGSNGSIAFGGDGSITSNIKNGDNETTFETKDDSINSKVTDGTNTTTNDTRATGNTSTVTNGTFTSDSKQTATSIGGVVTNGTVKVAQTLDGENGQITNSVTDKDGNSSNMVQNGKGFAITDSQNTDTETRFDGGDVSIGSKTDENKRINLSDLGQLGDLNEEVTARDEYKQNSTAVGAINSVSGRLTDEVNRLDGRINDVSDRVNKVGAMAAAIASLKSIGYDPQAPSEFSIGLGQYKGETGVAMGFFHYPNKNFMINVSLSTAGGETMGGIGATWRFGHKSPQKLLDEQRAAQAKKELAAAEKYQAAAKLAKEAQERAEYAAKLARQAQVSADNAKAAADATQAKHF